MNKLILSLLTALLLTIAWPAFAADWTPDPDDDLQVASAREIRRLLADQPKLQQYFDEAHGYAIFPTVGRIAAGFGFVFGGGLVIEQGRLVGSTQLIMGALGFDFGAQLHSQIIFFQDEEIMNEFKTFGWEFQGRGSVVLVTLGASVDPGYKPPVAIFSRTRGGLMIELAAQAGKYFYSPLKFSASNDSHDDSD
jgi:lipid-binding SYLF domain-containing protein